MFDNRKAMELQNLYGVENFKKLTISQMLERAKLIELLESAESAVYWDSSDKGFIEKIADHLIANGVRIPVPCKDCKHYIEDTLTCIPRLTLAFEHPNYYPDDFCSYGERKDNDST